MSKGNHRETKGKVLHFDENLGRGTIKLETGEKIKITYRQIEGEGFKILFEGECVIVKGGKVFPMRQRQNFD